MTPNLLVRCLEEAAEYGDRFPDQPDADVLNHVSEVCKLSAYLEEDWAVSRCILSSYRVATCAFPQDEAVQTGLDVAKAWGLVPKDFTYDPNRIYVD